MSYLTIVLTITSLKMAELQLTVKMMLTVSFNYCRVVHHEYTPEGQTVNKQYYQEVLRRLHDAVRRKRPDLWESRNWQLHHDNALTHSSCLIQDLMTKHRIPQVRQAPYFPDMAPCDFWLFPKLKIPLKGSRFERREDIMKNATAELVAIPKEDSQKCFQQWKDCWVKCVESQGDYFEGD
jgi:transposase